MGAAHRKSIVRETIERLDGKMAIGESRRDAKITIRKEGGPTWSVSTGRIHSYKTRTTYQEQCIRFVKWAREQHHISSLAELDPHAHELATAYLQQQVASDKSPYTVQVERAALRLFFTDRTLASTVAIPRRERANITRSRGPKQHDRHFQPENWPRLVRFLQAVGLRRHELHVVCCRDIGERDGHLTVHVKSGKGGLERYAPVLAGREMDVLSMSQGREPEELVFSRIPKHVDVHSYRREYAQSLYLQYAPGRSLPPVTGRLKRKDYDWEAAKLVSYALGHQRVDVATRHYLR
jgi:Phage integrase, N-terminal SAM-like domain